MKLSKKVRKWAFIFGTFFPFQFLALMHTIGIRLSEEDEFEGSDRVEHGVQTEYSNVDYLFVFRLTNKHLSHNSEATKLKKDEKQYGALTNEEE